MDINYDEVFDLEEQAEEQTQEQQTEQTEEKPAEEQQEGKAPAPKEQTPEERARQAEGRRIREREARARQEERERINATIKGLGIVYPQGHEKAGQAITTVDELEAYEREQSDDRLARGNGNAGDVRRIVREEMDRASAPEKAAQPAPTDPRIEAELAQIKALDPDTNGDLDIIMAGPYGAKFADYVQNKHLSFIEAYKLAAEDKINQLRAGQATEAARVRAASKDHLSSTKTQGTGAAPVPHDVAADYRVFFPEASEAEIQKMYTADQKRMKR